jgi:hypothetical protein
LSSSNLKLFLLATHVRELRIMMAIERLLSIYFFLIFLPFLAKHIFDWWICVHRVVIAALFLHLWWLCYFVFVEARTRTHQCSLEFENGININKHNNYVNVNKSQNSTQSFFTIRLPSIRLSTIVRSLTLRKWIIIWLALLCHSNPSDFLQCFDSHIHTLFIFHAFLCT